MSLSDHLQYKEIEKSNRKERALKYGLKRMRTLLDKKSRELAKINQQLRLLHHTLNEKKCEVNQLNRELEESNSALAALVRHLDKERETFESKISRSVMTEILPIINTLQHDKRLSRYTLELSMLEFHIGGLSKDGLKNQEMQSCLSETEGQIATLIKQGMTSKKIAALLCISSETVRTHRKNIRKKLKIQNTDVNLRTHLNQNYPTGNEATSRPDNLKKLISKTLLNIRH